MCHDLDEDDQVNGVYRDLPKFLVQLATFYLTEHNSSLQWFGEENVFRVALGGDGAPFGKDDTATSFLVSFLNIGQKVLSPEHNFLIFGANCSEDCKAVRKYIQLLSSQIVTIEENTFSVNGRDVKCRFTEFPNDFKMLAFLFGELTNNAKYFSSFANVSNDDASDINKTYGSEPQNR